MSTIDDRAPVDGIYGCPIFKRLALTSLELTEAEWRIYALEN